MRSCPSSMQSQRQSTGSPVLIIPRYSNSCHVALLETSHYSLCNGQSPEGLNYDTNVMRKHLAGCLEDKVFRHFPARKRTVKQETKRSEVLKVYCTCRLPEGGERMIACDNCGEWYHERLVIAFQSLLSYNSGVELD